MHLARALGFDELVAGLERAKAAGMVNSRDHADGRRLYIYSQKCVYENGWNDFALVARGLILHPDSKQVVATPFPKFFNVGERGLTFPEGKFQTYEKVDGSLVVIHQFAGDWRASTKGAFDSTQAKWTERRLSEIDTSHLDPGTTYLAEAVYPENRIVVFYEKPELVLLAAYDPYGQELTMTALENIANNIGWRVAETYSFDSFLGLSDRAKALPASAEGFVVRFPDGMRLKIKGDEYRRIHALISRCTPLAMWEAMMAGDDMPAIRRDLPEEFWADFDSITTILSGRLDNLLGQIAVTAAAVAGKTDKELGLSLNTIDPDVRPFIFNWRKFGGHLQGKSRDSLYRAVRPTGNILPGYTPSYAMHRVTDETA